MAEEKSKEGAKVKKQKWVQILAPKSFNNEIIGEIYTSEIKSLIGRVVTVNLMTLSKDIKNQNANLRFVITHAEGGKGITELDGYYLIPASVRRLVRRGKKRIDLSFTCKTSDNKNVRIKPLIIPRTKVKSSVSAELRRAIISYCLEQLSKMTFENVIRELINSRLQKALKDSLKKIYPVRILEVSAFYIEKEKKPFEEKKAEAEIKEEEVKGEEEPTEKEEGNEEEKEAEAEIKEEKTEADPKKEAKE